MAALSSNVTMQHNAQANVLRFVIFIQLTTINYFLKSIKEEFPKCKNDYRILSLIMAVTSFGSLNTCLMYCRNPTDFEWRQETIGRQTTRSLKLLEPFLFILQQRHTEHMLGHTRWGNRRTNFWNRKPRGSVSWIFIIVQGFINRVLNVFLKVQ